MYTYIFIRVLTHIHAYVHAGKAGAANRHDTSTFSVSGFGDEALKLLPALVENLQVRVAACCSVLQRIAAWCSMLQRVAVQSTTRP